MENTIKPGRSSKASRYAAQVLHLLQQEYPDAHCELDWETPLQLLVATILSAQCTDVRVNIVTKELFQKYSAPEDYLVVPEEELQNDIRSTGFFRNKTRSIRGACARIIEEFHGEVPRTMEELLTLPGVARKTANVILGTAFNVASGIVVDTHVLRLSYRIGLSKEKDPQKVEKDLIKLFPKDQWISAGQTIVWHGRRVCYARKPNCGGCTLQEICPKKGVLKTKK